MTTTNELSHIDDVPGYLFIGGAYRSGTTLLLHLLDSHPQLVVFPVENCIIRDLTVFTNLPNPNERSIVRLLELLQTSKFDTALEYVYDHDKLGQPLHSEIELSGSTGNQIVHTEFDSDKFRAAWLDYFLQLPDEIIIDPALLFRIYTLCYFHACNTDLQEEIIAYIASKCPECGYCVNDYMSHFPRAKVIHVIRDPRNTLSSHKRGAGIPIRGFYPLFLKQLSGLKNSLQQAASHSGHRNFMVVRYEDLTTNLDQVMKGICRFLEIEFSQVLTQPTIMGVPWRSNSSNGSLRDETTVFQRSEDAWKQELNHWEVQLIEAELGGLMEQFEYDRSLATVSVNKAHLHYNVRAMPYEAFRKVRRGFGRMLRFRG